MARRCALSALIRLLPGFFGFRGFFFHQVLVLAIDGGPEDGATTRPKPREAREMPKKYVLTY